VGTANPTAYNFTVSQPQTSVRDFLELTLGFTGILAVLWLPAREQLIFGPIALLAPLALVLWQRPSTKVLGLNFRAFVSSWWILPASAAFGLVAILLARAAGTFHPLYDADFTHVGGYVLWTVYQQFLLQDYFMPRLTRFFRTDAAIALAAVLFAVAHLPNLTLTVATLVWGAVSCALFRRYRSLYVVGIAQGLLGLCFAVCVPDAFHHHMRVGLGYFHYQPLVTSVDATAPLK